MPRQQNGTRDAGDEAVARLCAPESLDEDNEHLFVDEDFPADSSTLAKDAPSGTVWRRPRELCEEPEMFVDGACRYDVVQGDLGNCWSMAALAAVADKADLINQVVPPGQILHGPGYSGRIVIRLWHMECWRDIVIDDLLPVNEDNELLYARKGKNEFWMPLVEKALAKFHGGYQNLHGGRLQEGFINLTGYSVRNVLVQEFERSKNLFFNLLRKEINNGSLIVCAREGTFTRGLPPNHGYTVTDVRHLRSWNKPVRLLRVRNPWGDDEWTGKWRDDHPIWKDLDAESLKQLDANKRMQCDGEFWMKLVDFLRHFEEVCIASRHPSVHEERILPATNMKLIRTSWVENRAGGPFGKTTYSENPQILLEVRESEPKETAADGDDDVDDDGDGGGAEDAESDEGGAEDGGGPPPCAEESDCPEAGIPVLVELLQDHNRRQTTDLFVIGFDVFTHEGLGSVWQEGEETRLSEKQLSEEWHQAASVGLEDPHSAVSGYLHLKPGLRYVVVPHTDTAGQHRRFLLRVYSRNPHVHLRELGNEPGGSSGDVPEGSSEDAS